MKAVGAGRDGMPLAGLGSSFHPFLLQLHRVLCSSQMVFSLQFVQSPFNVRVSLSHTDQNNRSFKNMRKNSIREIVFKNDQMVKRLLDPRSDVRD